MANEIDPISYDDRSDNEREDQRNKSLEQNDQDESSVGDSQTEEFFESIPEQDRGKVFNIIEEKFFSGFMQRSNSFADKLTPEHIGKVIDHADERDKRDREDSDKQKSFHMKILVIGLLFLGGIIWFLHADKDLLLTIFTSVASFVGGYGLGKSKQ